MSVTEEVYNSIDLSKYSDKEIGLAIRNTVEKYRKQIADATYPSNTNFYLKMALSTIYSAILEGDDED